MQACSFAKLLLGKARGLATPFDDEPQLTLFGIRSQSPFCFGCRQKVYRQ